MLTVLQELVNSANHKKLIQVSGRYWRLLDTVNPVNVRYGRNGQLYSSATQVEKGAWMRLQTGEPDFDSLEIETASDETVKLLITDGEAGYDAVVLLGPRSVKFTASGSYVVPAGVSLINVKICGAGGGGGGGHNAAGGGGGGGGGGGTMVECPVAVTPGESLAVTIAPAAAGGAAGAAGSNGVQSTLTRSGVPLAAGLAGAGGQPGTVTNGGAGGDGGRAGSGTPVAAGGATTVGAPNNGAYSAAVDGIFSRLGYVGGGGSGGGPSNAGGFGGAAFGKVNSALASAGGAANGTDGGGGGGGTGPYISGQSTDGDGGAGTSAGNAATRPGSGGGGGGCQAAGAAGAAGLCIIETM